MKKRSTQTKFHIQKGKITGLQQDKTIKIIIIQTPKPKYNPKKCKWCNTTYNPTSSHNLYCSEDCRVLARQKHGRDRITRFRRKYKDVLNTLTRYITIGTGGLGEHRANTDEEEYQKIQKELKIIGIK